MRLRAHYPDAEGHQGALGPGTWRRCSSRTLDVGYSFHANVIPNFTTNLMWVRTVILIGLSEGSLVLRVFKLQASSLKSLRSVGSKLFHGSVLCSSLISRCYFVVLWLSTLITFRSSGRCGTRSTPNLYTVLNNSHPLRADRNL